jgi:hypothetical protein
MDETEEAGSEEVAVGVEMLLLEELLPQELKSITEARINRYFEFLFFMGKPLFKQVRIIKEFGERS